MKIPTEEGVFELGTFVIESGIALRNTIIVYKTHGRLNADKSNVIVYPTPIGAQHSDIEWPIGPGKALDPDRYFIVVLDQLGNGLSSSPSNSPPPLRAAAASFARLVAAEVATNLTNRPSRPHLSLF